MTTQYGHDPRSGHLFVWNREITYAGRTDNPPGVPFLVSNDPVVDSMAGAYFLAGSRQPASVFWNDGHNERSASLIRDSSGKLNISRVRSVCFLDRIVLCGPVVSDASAVAEFCERFPVNSVYVCPLMDELPAFGSLVIGLCAAGLDWPRRANLFSPFETELPGESLEYEKQMEADAYGKMAYSVARGGVIVNQVMRGPGVSPFYGRFLSSNPINEQPVYLVNSDCVETLLASTPISVRVFAATSVPIRVKVSERFREATGHRGDKATVFVASDFVVGLGSFMVFYGALTKSGVVVSSAISLLEGCEKVPVYRYNKAYLVSLENLDALS